MNMEISEKINDVNETNDNANAVQTARKTRNIGNTGK